MLIQNISQLKQYAQTLPWYKRIFFPQTIWDRLNDTSAVEDEIRTLYALEIEMSWLKSFYIWLFPEFDLFIHHNANTTAQPIPLDRHIPPLPEDYEALLKDAIVSHNNPECIRLISFLSLYPIDTAILIRILRTSLRMENDFSTRMLLENPVYNAEVVSQVFLNAISNVNNEWWGIEVVREFTTEEQLSQKLSAESLNEGILHIARDYQQLALSQDDRASHARFDKEYDLKELLRCQNTRNKITLTTIHQMLLHMIVPLLYEPDDIQWIDEAIHFEDSEGQRLSESCIQSMYLHTIKMGRIKPLAAFQTHQIPVDEAFIQALKDAAKGAHYPMVMHLISRIPEHRRFDILQTKSLIKNDKTFKDSKEPEYTHILQWAACRGVPEDIQTIVDALVNAQERGILITNTPHADEYSPLLLAAVNCRKDNLTIMLNALLPAQRIDAILPQKITFWTPLDPFYSHPKERHKTAIIPILLNVLFGDNQALHSAYQTLNARDVAWNRLKQLRDHYLAVNFPTTLQRTLSFFSFGFSIPGHTLSEDELNLVVKVVLYQNYHRFDYIQRGAIESRMDAYDLTTASAAHHI